MVEKFFLTFFILLSLTLIRPTVTYAFEFDFLGLRGAVNELINGPKQQEEEKPSIFQQFFSWIGSIWKKGDVFAPKLSPTPTPINNPFPQPSPSTLGEPQLEERPLTPQQDGGPIKKSTVSGSWHGNFDTKSPEECAGEDGGWEANLVETNGKISGTYKSDLGGGGSVSGSSTGNQTTWNIGGSGGVSYKGTISGNTVSGSFTGPICDKEEAPQPTKGSFFGGRL